MALGVHLECRYHRLRAGKNNTVKIIVKGRDSHLISAGEDNLIWQTALRIAREVGQPLLPIELEIDNAIPLGKGLGSSAAALTAGIVIADDLLKLRWPKSRVLDEAARLEGHPDNVAACVLGSIVASATDSLGVTHAVKMELHNRFALAVVVPDFTLPTVESRRVLPTSYSKADAIFNIQRSTLLITALATGAADAFPTALEDRMHQPYRAALVPGLAEIIKLRTKGLLGCALSGAGPSILVFYERGYQNVCHAVQRIFAKHGKDSEVIVAELSTCGYEFV